MELGQESNISEVFTVVQIYIYPNPKTKDVLQRCGICRAISCLMKLNFTILRSLLFNSE